MKKNGKSLNSFIYFLFLFLFLFSDFTIAQTEGSRTGSARLLVSPASQSVISGSTFDVSFLLDTAGKNINSLELNIKFPPDKLTIVNPSTGTSFISIWAQPPIYSNVDGTAKFSGGVPNGIVTSGSSIVTITFKAKNSGNARIEILPSSKVLANDGLGTNVLVERLSGNYSILSKPPNGVKVFSETHPSESIWYNNNSSIIAWDSEDGVEGFSYEIDNKPFTVPDNIIDSKNTSTSFTNLSDGVWYFHIKAAKGDAWAGTTHFSLHIDTTPPASFVPKIQLLTAAVLERYLVSFSTTDSLSGLDHYEVGVVDKTAPPSSAPAFIEAESPYQIPFFVKRNMVVVVRAVDKAGNVRDEQAKLNVVFTESLLWIILLLGILIMILLHYLFGHRVIARIKRAFSIVKKEDKQKEIIEEKIEHDMNNNQFNGGNNLNIYSDNDGVHKHDDNH